MTRACGFYTGLVYCLTSSGAVTSAGAWAGGDEFTRAHPRVVHWSHGVLGGSGGSLKPSWGYREFLQEAWGIQSCSALLMLTTTLLLSVCLRAVGFQAGAPLETGLLHSPVSAKQLGFLGGKFHQMMEI